MQIESDSEQKDIEKPTAIREQKKKSEKKFGEQTNERTQSESPTI